MCEFKVFLGGKQVFQDVVYAREEGGKVLVRTVLGEERVFKNCKIVLVDVDKEVLDLMEVKEVG